MNELNLLYESFLKRSAGVPPTANQLLQAAKTKNSSLSKTRIAAFLKSKLVHAQFTAGKKRPKVFQTISVPRPGVFFVDYAEFHKEFAKFNNKGCTGFLICVENLTNKLFIFPCKGKSTAEWEQAMQALIDNTGYIRTIYSDRDSVATSPTFQKEMSEKYNIRWYFLRAKNKSYLAERYIRYVKEKLSQAMIIAQSKNWIQFVPGLYREYNNEQVEGATFKRKAINEANFNDFLSQVFRLKNPELAFNRARIGPFQNVNWNKALFSFKPGDSVLIARKANWREKLVGGAFFKASHQGSFSPRVYTISGRQLRAAKGFKKYVAVYSVTDLPETWFYEEDLKKV